MTMGSRGRLPTEDAMTAFSALHLIRNYNQLFAPPGANFIPGYNPYAAGGNLVEVHHAQREAPFLGDWPPILGAFQPYLSAPTPAIAEGKGSAYFGVERGDGCRRATNRLTDAGLALTTTLSPRRPRGEKKPIPEEQKDDRYYERRKRNNQAAKKSRDARKLREDQIALRAALLEHENAVLRAQIVTLREETQSLRQLLFMQGKVHGRAITASGDEDYKVTGLSDFCERSGSANEDSQPFTHPAPKCDSLVRSSGTTARKPKVSD